jgi:hypothetical protein
VAGGTRGTFLALRRRGFIDPTAAITAEGRAAVAPASRDSHGTGPFIAVDRSIGSDVSVFEAVDLNGNRLKVRRRHGQYLTVEVGGSVARFDEVHAVQVLQLLRELVA